MSFRKCRPFDSASICLKHYDDIIMGSMASQITSLAIVYSAFYSGADQRKYQNSASLAFVRGPVNSPQKWPVTRKMFPFDDVIMKWRLFVQAFQCFRASQRSVQCNCHHAPSYSCNNKMEQHAAKISLGMMCFRLYDRHRMPQWNDTINSFKTVAISWNAMVQR